MIRYAFRLACDNLKRGQNVTLPFFIASTVTVFLHFLIIQLVTISYKNNAYDIPAVLRYC